jgi:ABC-2 type transport system permease protein
MKTKLWDVFKYELLSVIRRKSFLITLFLLPLISGIIFIIAGKMNQNGGMENNPIVEMVAPQEEALPAGVVDQSALIKMIPEWVEGQLVLYSEQNSADIALEQGEISGYYLVPDNYLEEGKVILYVQDYNIMNGLENSWVIESALRENLLAYAGISPDKFDHPLAGAEIVVEQFDDGKPVVEQRDPDDGLTFMVPYVISMLFYIIIITTSSMLMNSITTEKENRVMEILLTSISPETMLFGKILSRGLTGLMQFLIWGGTGWVLLRLSGQTFQLANDFVLPISFMIWGVVFLLLGYFLYAVLMAGVGAMAPNMRESSQMTMFFVMPMILPLMFISVIAQAPNKFFPVFLSYFPLTSPLAMMMRFSLVKLPLWEPLLSALLLAGSAYLCMRLIAGLFRADLLLSGQSLNPKRYFQAIIQRNR